MQTNHAFSLEESLLPTWGPHLLRETCQWPPQRQQLVGPTFFVIFGVYRKGSLSDLRSLGHEAKASHKRKAGNEMVGQLPSSSSGMKGLYFIGFGPGD